MNDEIKEMNLSEMLFNRDEQLLDLITKLQEDVRTGQEINSELQQENERLKEQVNQYENPDDMTLFYMWLDAKAKDKMKELEQENERLKAKYDNNKSHEINYKYFATLYSKATKDIIIDDLVYKCEDLDNLKKSYEKLYIEKEDYKSRCEKTLDYVNNTSNFRLITLQNILQNGSEKDDR